MSENQKQKVAVTALLKFGLRQHMTQFREEGLLFCNPLAYFRSRDADETRRDLRDGISSSHLAEDVTAIVVSNADGETRLTPDNGLVGRVDIHLGGAEPNVYCMYAVRASDLPWRPDSRIYEFGDSGVVITDLDQFHERLIRAFSEAGLGLQTGLVEYVDPATYSGDLGVFKKFGEFAFHSELRLAIEPGSPEPIEIRLGSLADISVQFDVNEETDLEARANATAAV